MAAVGIATLAIGPAAALATHTTDDPEQGPKRAEKRHFLKMYKVEKTVTLFADEDGEYFHTSTDQSKDTHVLCRSGDYAIDGMWRMDTIDQNALGEQDQTDIQIIKSYADASVHNKWHYEFFLAPDLNADEEERDSRQAQVKLFATCLGVSTAENGHTHDWLLSNPQFETYGGQTAGALSPNLGADASANATIACNSDEYAIAPGFEWSGSTGTGATTSYARGDLQESRPRTSLRNWNWRFWVLESGSVTVRFKCLEKQSTTADSHHHHLSAYFKDDGNGTGFLKTLEADVGTHDGRETNQIGCHQHTKGMLHSFNIFDTDHYNWFLGMSPNPKKRAYRTWNKHTSDHSGRFGVVCWNDRTGKKHS